MKYLVFINLVTSIFFVSTSLASDQNIKIALPSWDGGKFIAYDLANQLEKKFGYVVKFVEIETDSMWVELDKNRGAVDIFPDLWMPNQEHNWKKFVVESGSVKFNKAPYSGKQGFYLLTGKDAIEAEIENIVRDETLALLDTDRDGLAEFWPGDPTWHSTIFNKVKLKSYLIGEKIELIMENNEPFIATLDYRAKNNLPLLFYYWEPDWIHAKYNILPVKEPPYTDGCRDIIDPSESVTWLADSKFGCAYPASSVYVVFRDEFTNDDKLGDFLENYAVDVEQLQKAILEKKETGRSLADIVTKL